MSSTRGASDLRFIPELLLGYDALDSSDRRNLSDFLVAVVRRRGFPLHLASLWNALYFGYAPDQQGYLGQGINLDRIPLRSMGQQIAALPVGGFVRVKTPTEELWAEVVYKEGRQEQVTCDWVPEEISGAPAPSAEHDGDLVSRVREALVLDYSAFGPTWNDIRPSRFARILRRGRWLDQFGHLVIDALYPVEAAALDDATFYAQYLFEQHRDGLGLLASYLGSEANDDDLWAHLLMSIRTVGDLAQNCPELDSWRGYFFDRAEFATCVLDQGADTHYGADELRHLFRRISNMSSRERVIYSAIGPQIIDVLARQGLDDDERALVEGPMYVRSVCYANAYVRDRIAEDAQEGILPQNCHLRLDDAWQAGGIWRAETVRDSSFSLARIPATIALGLGYASTHPAERPEEEEEPPIITSSQVGWRIALTQADIDAGAFRLSSTALDALTQNNGTHEVRLRHDGELCEQSTARFDPSAQRLFDIDWPLDAYPGIYVFANIERGGKVVKLRTELLSCPETIDGHLLKFQYAEAIYRGAREPISREILDAATSLDDLIHAVFRERGRKVANGGRALAMVEVLNAILGPDHDLDAARPIRIALQALNLEFADGLYVWYPRVTRRTRTLDRALLAAYGEASQERLRRIVRRHWVPMHLRRLTGGQQPSQEKRDGYVRGLREARLDGVFRPDLPLGYTWVAGHARGSRNNPDEHLTQS
jgi:hypothetical protein